MTSKFFDALARSFHGLGIVTFVMLFFIGSMIFFSHNMFLGVFPAGMEPWERNVAAWLMALGWEWTVLITTCNPQYIHRAVPRVAALASTVIVLFFVEAFDFSQGGIVLSQRWFIGILAGTIIAIFSQLFHKKWMDKTMSEALSETIEKLKATLSDRDLQLSQLKASVSDRDLQLSQLKASLSDRDLQLSQLNASIPCPHCNKPFTSENSLTAHKRHCIKKHKEAA